MRMFTVAKRLIKEIRGDKRSIGLMFIAPIFIIFLLSVILTSATSKPKIDIVSTTQSPAPVTDSFISALEKDVKVTMIENEDAALVRIKNKDSHAYVVFKNNVPNITVEGSEPKITNIVTSLVKKAQMTSMAAAKMSPSSTASTASQSTPAGQTAQGSQAIPSNNAQATQGGQASPVNNAQATQGGQAPTINNPQSGITIPTVLQLPEPVVNYLYSSADMDFFDSVAPLFMGFFIFFFVFLLAGIAFLRERISGTLDRILATPLKRYEIVLGYFLGFGLFIAIQTIIIQIFIVYGLNVMMNGSFLLILLINLLLASQSLALGTLLSAFAKNEFQLFQFIPIVIVPQILFSGIFDLSEAPSWVNVLSHVFPLTYGAKALRDVMIRGLGFMDIWKELTIIVTYAVVFLILNSLALKKYRKI